MYLVDGGKALDNACGGLYYGGAGFRCLAGDFNVAAGHL